MHPVDLICAAEYSRSRIFDHAAQRRLAAQTGPAQQEEAAAGLRHRLGQALILLDTRLTQDRTPPISGPASLIDRASGPSQL